jgi:hypothetical protein
MAQATDNTYESGRNETVDFSSGGPSKTGGSHWGSYAGMLIVALILLTMVFLQSATATNL